MFFRRSGGFLTPTLYFEDGVTFLSQQLQVDSWRLVFIPFTHGSLGDSYFLFLTRAIAYLTSKFPIEYAPYLMNGAGFLITSISISLFTLPVFRTVVKEDFLRIVFSILTATVLDGGEFFGTTTNIVWPLGIVIVYYLLLPVSIDKSRAKIYYFKVIALLIIAVSTPLSGLLLPFSFGKIILNRFKNSLPLVALSVGGAVEIFVNALFSSPNVTEKYIPEISVLLISLRNGFAHHVTLPMFFGYDVSKNLMKEQLGIDYFSGIMFIIAVGILLTAKKDYRKFKIVSFLLIVCSLNYILSFYKRDLWSFFYNLGETFFWDAPRYFFLSRVCLILVVFILIDVIVFNRYFKSIFSVLLFSFLMLNNFKLKEDQPNSNLNWADHYSEIEAWLIDSHKDSAKQISVPVYPSPVWKMDLPPSNLGYSSRWNWGANIDLESDSVLLSKTNKLTWKDLLLSTSGPQRFVVSTQYHCNVPDHSNVIMKLTDSFGEQFESKMKYFKCGRIKNISVVLPGGGRRAVKISFEYSGDRSVTLSDLRIESNSLNDS